MSTHKLVRVKNHYHIVGEECKHRGRQRKAYIWSKKSPKTRFALKNRGLGLTLLSWALFAAIYALFTPTVLTYAKEPELIDFQINLSLIPQPETLSDKIERLSEKHGVNPEKVKHIIQRESQYNPKAVGDMNIKCPKTGKPVRARGILQITECYWGHVSDACAFDPECALEVALPEMRTKQSCLSQWTTCKSWYKVKTVI